MLTELRQALYEAIADSSDVHKTWRKLRDQGYSLILTLDCKRQETEEGGELEPLVPAVGEPVFQINGQDLAFLRSIGIDPTRRPRRRRS